MKFKKCGPEHEAPYLFEVDKKWMRSGNDFSELLESIRKEAYLKGFRRGQEEASYGFWNKDCRKKFREDEETDKIIEHEHFWTAHDEWSRYIGKTASYLVASAYRSYSDGENAIDGVIETISAMLRIEFENTKQKENAESIGATLPVTQAEKWLSDDEDEGEGVSMLTMTREILKEGRKEGYDIGYMKGYMAGQAITE